MKRLLLILAILGATFVMSSATAEASRRHRGYYGYRGGHHARYGSYYRGPRAYYVYPGYIVGYGGGYYGGGYYGGYGGYCGW